MKIRKATIDDFGELKKLAVEFYMWECEREKTVDPDYIKGGIGVRLAKNLRSKRSIFFVAEDDEKTVGFSWNQIQKSPTWSKTKKYGHIRILYVETGYQNRGIGKRLIEEAISWFRKNGISEFRIESFGYNYKAHDIYKKIGFRDYITDMIMVDD